ncbi:MAG: FAD binding domain-containing protein [Acidimicrobiales bacterium]
MKNPPFRYHRPENVEEALALLAEFGDDCKVLAGGQSLLPIMALRLGRSDHIVDIGRIPGLDRIAVDDSGTTHIGALVRHAEAERSTELMAHAPLVSKAMPFVGHRAIRTRGTVCGSLAHADPAAEMPAVALASNATLVAASADESREIPVSSFFAGYLQTVLRPDELLIEVRFPRMPPRSGCAVVEVARRHGDYALVGLACAFALDDAGAVSGAALAFFGAGSVPVRALEAEAALLGAQPTGDAFDAAAELVSNTLDPGADIHASANYRRHIAGVLTRKGLAEAHAQIGTLV